MIMAMSIEVTVEKITVIIEIKTQGIAQGTGEIAHEAGVEVGIIFLDRLDLLETTGMTLEMIRGMTETAIARGLCKEKFEFFTNTRTEGKSIIFYARRIFLLTNYACHRHCYRHFHCCYYH